MKWILGGCLLCMVCPPFEATAKSEAKASPPGPGKARAAPPGSASPPPRPKTEGDEPGKRAKREEVEVVGVLDTQDGEYVVILKTTAAPARYLPIWIGELEALNIRLRLQRQKPPRPLTLNLLENILRSGDIQLVEIDIDDVNGGIFLGRLALKQRGRRWHVDARPSDAIGLAVGQGAPIFVSREVMDHASVDPNDLRDPERPKGAPAVSYDETL